MNKEPATIVSAVTALITALIGLGVAFGLDISDEQQNAIIGVVLSASLVIGMVGPIIRNFVTPTQKAEDAIHRAYMMQPGEQPVPTL